MLVTLGSGFEYNSCLMFGVQWNLVLKHIEVKTVKNAEEDKKATALANIKKELKEDSTSWGSFFWKSELQLNRGKKSYSPFNTWVDFNDSTVTRNESPIHTCGASDLSCKFNIYDLAGNMSEWTMAHDNPITSCMELVMRVEGRKLRRFWRRSDERRFGRD